jgi:putative glycosyltransferase (TIGR04372 family)
MADYAELRVKTRHFIPFNVAFSLPKRLLNLIGSSKYIVIQIKTESVNGTLKPVNPSTYLEAIRKAKKNGYTIVLGGREKMPDIFQSEGVINYSESDAATPLNDFLLVLNSDAVIASASGFSFIADIIEKPLLTLNCWHIVGYPGYATIAIPSRIRYEGNLLSLFDQYAFAIKHGQGIHELELCDPVDANSQDILDGYEQLIHLIDNKKYPESVGHKVFRNLFIDGPLPIQDSVISEKFLEKNFL